MNELSVMLENCYGIQYFQHDFSFNSPGRQTRAYAIYAPNGLMKTSFSKTFEKLSGGQEPKEERYNRPSSYIVESDGTAISKDMIYVLKSEIDISTDSPAITNILVNPENKARYDELLVDLDSQKKKLIRSLQITSKVKQAEVEKRMLNDWNETDFCACVARIMEISVDEDFSPYDYNTIFDPKTVAVLESPEFIAKASEFNQRYQDLFDQAGTIYQKGVFNPTKADISFGTLGKQGFFAGGHRIHLKGESESIDKDELDEKLLAIHADIDGDDALKKLRTSLAKNAQTQALTELIENLSPTQVEFLLDRLKPENQSQTRKDLWVFYIQNNPDAMAYLELYETNKSEIKSIEATAAESAPRWNNAVELFNDRFVNMPFTLSVANQTQAALGKENAKLKFTFRDGNDAVEWTRQEIKTLSQGEKRALYLLNFIFEVEARKLANKDTLFIVDDVADSFDYKNKHAIVQYLDDLNDIENFYQIILTHNFDFFRALSLQFVHRKNCLMTTRNDTSISLVMAEGINNYFIGKWKNNVMTCDVILCATIPFSRNLIEYTKGDGDDDYKTLTSLLHWKEDTNQITVGKYLNIYNKLFNSDFDENRPQTIKNLMFTKAREICASNTHNGLSLEDKVLLSIAIRVRAEIFLTNKLRILKSDASYWCSSMNQFGSLVKEYSSLSPDATGMRTLEKVSVTVSSNIHLNSFMYEPILDLTIDHLIDLYGEVSNLESL